jgi:hypothetical protein
MTNRDKVNAILHIRPNAEFILRGDEIEWLDESQTQPTDKEIEAGWLAYQAAEKAKAEAKATAKAALLDKLGITAEEAQLLLS